MAHRRTPVPLLLTLLVALVAVPSSQGGTSDAPEVSDTVDDGGLDQLDIQKLWIDTSDELNLTFHLVLGAELPSIPATSRCEGSDCTFTSLTYRIVFHVTDADGVPLPQAPGYNRSYVAYRHGPNGTLVSPVGTFDGEDVLTLTGSANVTIDGTELVLRIARSNAAVNMPTGPQPGSIVDRMYAYDSPQACHPEAGCAPVLKPVVGEPGVDVLTLVNEWDRAPDVGYANATAFPAPPPTAPTAPVAPAPTPTPTPTPTKAPTAPAPGPEPSGHAIVEGESTTTGTTSGLGKESPPPAPGLVLLALVALAVAARRMR